MARPTHQPFPALRRQVEAMAGFGVPESDIARVIGVDPKTLRKHYRHEADTGHVKANAKVTENLYRKAAGEGREAVVAAIFWLKTRARWKETSVHEVGGRGGRRLHLRGCSGPRSAGAQDRGAGTAAERAWSDGPPAGRRGLSGRAACRCTQEGAARVGGLRPFIDGNNGAGSACELPRRTPCAAGSPSPPPSS